MVQSSKMERVQDLLVLASNQSSGCALATHVVTQTGTTVAVGGGDTVQIEIPDGGTAMIEGEMGFQSRNAADNVSAELKNGIDIAFIDDTHSDEVVINLSTFSGNRLLIDIEDYDPAECVKLVGAFNMGPNPGKSDEFVFDYVGSDGRTYSGFIHAKDSGENNFTTEPPINCICFTPGVLIATEAGEVPVEDLKVGDRVITADNGLQAIRWIGKRYFSGARLYSHPDLRPIRIRRHAFGENVPERDMLVSPQHQMMLTSTRAQLLYGEREVLVPAKGLVDDRTVAVDHSVSSVQYVHLLFDRHEMIFANGALTESFHPGFTSLRGMDEAPRREIYQIFPELENDRHQFGPSARFALRPLEALSLLR